MTTATIEYPTQSHAAIRAAVEQLDQREDCYYLGASIVRVILSAHLRLAARHATDLGLRDRLRAASVAARAIHPDGHGEIVADEANSLAYSGADSEADPHARRVIQCAAYVAECARQSCERGDLDAAMSAVQCRPENTHPHK